MCTNCGPKVCQQKLKKKKGPALPSGGEWPSDPVEGWDVEGWDVGIGSSSGFSFLWNALVSLLVAQAPLSSSEAGQSGPEISP